MKVSMRGDYGIRALVDLAQNYGTGTIQSSDIAERQHIPGPYLDQLLTVLRKAGFINSRRGPQGGHELAKEPSQITLAEVVESLEGSIASIGCLDGSMDCYFSTSCGQQEIWATIAANTKSILEATTIAALAERQNALQKNRVMYYI